MQTKVNIYQTIVPPVGEEMSASEGRKYMLPKGSTIISMISADINRYTSVNMPEFYITTRIEVLTLIIPDLC